MRRRPRVGEILVAEHALGPLELADALDGQREDERLGHAAVRLGLITERQLVEALAAQLCIDTVDPRDVTPDASAIALVPHPFAAARELLPLTLGHGRMSVAMADPTNLMIIDDLRTWTGIRTITPLAAPRRSLLAAIETAYNPPREQADLQHAAVDEQACTPARPQSRPVIRVRQLVTNTAAGSGAGTVNG